MQTHILVLFWSTVLSCAIAHPFVPGHCALCWDVLSEAQNIAQNPAAGCNGLSGSSLPSFLATTVLHMMQKTAILGGKYA